MMNLGDTAFAQVRASSRSPRKKAAAPRTVKVAVRAVQLYGRWLRVSRRGVPVMSGCACGFDLAIELGELDAMILEFLLKKFSPKPEVRAFLERWLAPEQRFSNGLQNMLQAFTTPSMAWPMQRWPRFWMRWRSALAPSRPTTAETHGWDA